MEALLQRTTKEEQKIAVSSVSLFKKASRSIKGSKKRGVRIKIQETGEFITIPRKALSLLFEILTHMAEGNSIALLPSTSEVSTQQAADMLNVSRPHLVKLLEGNAIPFKKTGSHRRILLKDLIEYEAKLKKNREEKLQFLAK
ncbi:MAG TPA: excisionase family DNA-binding protein, partial [Saprospiraceae bacterium]|nr:excisionase family DNA-binding protein [Saprospiraceae bacterium]